MYLIFFNSMDKIRSLKGIHYICRHYCFVSGYLITAPSGSKLRELNLLNIMKDVCPIERVIL